MGHGLLLAIACSLGLLASPAAGATSSAQEPNSRQRAGLAEDQALLLRQLARLKQTMEVLAQRYETEGRTHAAKLLRDGLKHLEERAADGSGRTLEDLMKAAKESLSSELSGQSIETQEQIVKSLDRLYSILTDRVDMRDLEKSLADVAAIRKELGELTRREAELRKATEALREDSASKESKELTAGIQKALDAQRALQERTERESRANGQHEFKELERKLDELIQREATDRAVLEAWNAAETEALRKASPAIDRAAAEARRAQRLAEAAEELRRAARDVREPGSDLTAPQKALESASEREARDQRTTQDATAGKTAEALREGAEDVKQSASDPTAREATAKKLEARAEQLASEAEERRAAAERASTEAGEKLEPLARNDSAAGRVAEGVRQALEARRPRSAAANQSQGGDRNRPPDGPASENAEKPSPEAAARRAAEEQRATENARKSLERGLQELDTLKKALSASQAEAAEEARRIARDLDTLPQGATPAGEEAQAALQRAAEAQAAASEQAARSEAEPAAESARRAESELARAREALSRARQESARQSAASAENQEQRAEQERLEEAVKALEKQAEEAGLESEAQRRTEAALEAARQSMQRAGQSMQQGASAEAAQSQSEAQKSLEEAREAAREGGQSMDAEDQKRAEELRKEQEEIKKRLLELAERNKKRNGARPAPSMEQAAESAQRAQDALESGELDDAEREEEEAERQMNEADRELREEEEQYQKLRAEELLFKIADEVKLLLGEHQKQMTATTEVDAARKDGARPTHSQRLRLRKIAQAEGALGTRAAEIAQAIAAEESLVFAEILDQVKRDLGRIAKDMDEAGDWQSGERVQALQSDVEENLKWLGEALNEEKERRRQEQREQQGGEQDQGQNRPAQERLVPDGAELKLLRRMEVETLRALEELRQLHPEIEAGTSVDPLVLEDLARLAYKHQRTTDLFQKFRKRLGVPDPEEEDP